MLIYAQARVEMRKEEEEKRSREEEEERRREEDKVAAATERKRREDEEAEEQEASLYTLRAAKEAAEQEERLRVEWEKESRWKAASLTREIAVPMIEVPVSTPLDDAQLNLVREFVSPCPKP
jgi:translation initiation factor 4G